MDNTERLKVIFERFLQDQCSAEEVEELFSYIKEKPVSSELNPLLEDVWSKLEEYPSLDTLHRNRLFEKIKIKTDREIPKRNWLSLMKIAAVVVLIVAIGIIFTQREEGKSEIAVITKTTQTGQRASYKLPDGSSVSLNSGSTISFPEKFNADTRIVHLEGEAFFEVVKNDRQPFIVESAAIKTMVLGTSFNVRAYRGQDIEITVATGKVQVETLSRSTSENDGLVLLTPNQQAVYSFERNGIIQSTVDVRKFLAWNSKEIILENTPMKDVIFMLEKRFDQKIIIENSEMGNCIIRKARYDKESLETILKGLQTILDFKYQFNGYNQWKLIGNGCK